MAVINFLFVSLLFIVMLYELERLWTSLHYSKWDETLVSLPSKFQSRFNEHLQCTQSCKCIYIYIYTYIHIYIETSQTLRGSNSSWEKVFIWVVFNFQESWAGVDFTLLCKHDIFTDNWRKPTTTEASLSGKDIPGSLCCFYYPVKSQFRAHSLNVFSWVSKEAFGFPP